MTQDPSPRRAGDPKALPPTCPPGPHEDRDDPSQEIGSCSQKTWSLHKLYGPDGFPSWEPHAGDIAATKLHACHEPTAPTRPPITTPRRMPPVCPPNRRIPPAGTDAARMG